MKRILLVEDQFGFMTQDLLQIYGDLEIVLATRGDEAVEVFAAHKFDAVVLDLRLPVLDGFIVLQAIRKIEPDTPVIIVSAWSDQDRRQRARELGAAAFFGKPPNFRDVHRKLLEVMATRPRQRPGDTIHLEGAQVELLAKHRRLNLLKEEAARKGIDTPPQVRIEIEDLEDELRRNPDR